MAGSAFGNGGGGGGGGGRIELLASCTAATAAAGVATATFGVCCCCGCCCCCCCFTSGDAWACFAIISWRRRRDSSSALAFFSSASSLWRSENGYHAQRHPHTHSWRSFSMMRRVSSSSSTIGSAGASKLKSGARRSVVDGASFSRFDELSLPVLSCSKLAPLPPPCRRPSLPSLRDDVPLSRDRERDRRLRLLWCCTKSQSTAPLTSPQRPCSHRHRVAHGRRHGAAPDGSLTR